MEPINLQLQALSRQPLADILIGLTPEEQVEDLPRRGRSNAFSRSQSLPTRVGPDPATPKLKQLIASIASAAAIRETPNAVGAIAQFLKQASALSDDLALQHHFDTINMTLRRSEYGDTNFVFKTFQGQIKVAWLWYSRLDFYRTKAGRAFLSEAFTAKLPGSDADKELVGLKMHRMVENLSPIGFENWSMRDWLAWSSEKLDEFEDPLAHFVEFMLENSFDLTEIMDRNQARISKTEDLRGAYLARVRTHVPNHESFGTPGLPRLWTFRINRLTFMQRLGSTAPEGRPNEFGLPTLQPLNSPPTKRPGIPDLTRGSLYVLDAANRLYCYDPDFYYHSALLAGEPVKAAGLLTAENGRVVAIDNRSGHYQPRYRHLLAAVTHLLTNRLFEPNAFVSLYLNEHNAAYFSPQQFVQVANQGLKFEITTKILAERAAAFNGRCPVALQLVDLIPANLRDFPKTTHRGQDRWDLMVLSLYGQEVQVMVDALRQALKQERQSIGLAPTQMLVVSNYMKIVSKWELSLSSGGAYLQLIPMLQELISASDHIFSQRVKFVPCRELYQSLLRKAQVLQPNVQNF